MDLTQLADIKSTAALIGAFIFAVWIGIPQLIKYLERKDTAHREMVMTLVTKHQEDMKALVAKHQEDMMSLVAAGRDERDKFYASLAIDLDRIHNRLDKLTQQKGTSS